MGWFSKRKKKAVAPKSITPNDQGTNVYSANFGNLGFDGAKFPHALDFYKPDLFNIPALRAHARKQYSTNTTAHAVIDTMLTSVINRGLMLEAKPLASLYGFNVPDDWAKNTELLFDLWAQTKGCDYAFNFNFYQLQGQAYRQFLLTGKTICIPRFIPAPRKGRMGRINFQLIPTDYLVTPPREKARVQKAGGDIIDGMRLDSTGTIVGAYFQSRKASLIVDPQAFIYIPTWAERTGRKNLIISFNPYGVGDTTGIPEITHILHDLDKIGKYQVAEIQAAVVNADIALIQNSDGELPNPPMLTTGVGKRTSTGTDADGNEVTKTEVKTLAPGMHVFASQAGQSLSSYDTKRPNVNFDSFVDSTVKIMSSSLGLPIEILHKRFSSNYSASRAALLEYWKDVTKRRCNFAWDFCQPAYELWLSEQIQMGIIPAEGWVVDNMMERVRNRKSWAHADWQGIAKGSVDPFKEARAAILAEDRGWTTAEANAREINGKNFDTNIDRRESEAPRQREVQIDGDGTT